MEAIELRRVLGLDAEADREELKAAYRYLAKKYHPDRSGDPRTGIRFSKIILAYRTLELDFGVSESAAPSEASAASRHDDFFSLGDQLLHAASARTRRRAARHLGFLGRKAAYIFLKRALDDRDESVVAAAVRSIADLSLYQAAGELAALWARSGSSIRMAILDAAEDTGEPVFQRVLELIAKNNDPNGHRARMLLKTF